VDGTEGGGAGGATGSTERGGKEVIRSTGGGTGRRRGDGVRVCAMEGVEVGTRF